MYLSETADWVSPPILFIYFYISYLTCGGRFLDLIRSYMSAVSALPDLEPPKDIPLEEGEVEEEFDFLTTFDMSCLTFYSI